MHEQPVNADVRYEESDASMKPMIWMGIGIVMFGLIANVVCWWMFDAFKSEKQVSRSPVASDRASFWTEEGRKKIPEPRLQINEGQDKDQFRQTEDAHLSSYGWTDKAKGTVHIPIDQAIKLMSDPAFAKAKGIRVAPGGKQ